MASDTSWSGYPFKPASGGLGTYRILESVESEMPEERLESIRTALYGALPDFPELDGRTVTVGCLERHHEYDDPNGVAGIRNCIVYIPVDRPTDWTTLYHELAHLAIGVRYRRGEDVPITSEEFCSIFAVARMAPYRIDRGSLPYLGTPDAPRADWPRICREALAYREEHRDYVQYCKGRLGVGGGG